MEHLAFVTELSNKATSAGSMPVVVFAAVADMRDSYPGKTASLLAHLVCSPDC